MYSLPCFPLKWRTHEFFPGGHGRTPAKVRSKLKGSCNDTCKLQKAWIQFQTEKKGVGLSLWFGVLGVLEFCPVNFPVAPQLLTTSNFVGPWYHAAVLFSGLGSIVLLFGVLFSQQIREDLVRAATSPKFSFESFFCMKSTSNLYQSRLCLPVHHLYVNKAHTLIGIPVQCRPNGNRHLFPLSLSYPMAN